MLVYHILAVGSVMIVGMVMLMIYSGKDDYQQIKLELHQKFNEDFLYTQDLIRELTPRESDMKIDEFEDKWMNYVSKSELKAAIGKLIEAQYLGLGV
jgi:hypothetical protein